jgi:hypothetical protein
MPRFRVHEIPDTPNSDCVRSTDTRPSIMDGPDCIGESRIAISLCANPLSPGTPIPDLRLFGSLCHVSLPEAILRATLPDPTIYGISTPDLMAQIVSSHTPALNPCAASPDPTADGKREPRSNGPDSFFWVLGFTIPSSHCSR